MLTQLSTIKTRLGIEPFDTTDDVLLTNLIKHVSARFTAQCNRIFDYAANLTYDFRADATNLIVHRPPIESVSSFYLKSTEAEGWLLQSAIDYLLLPEKAVIELAQPLGTSQQLGRVIYTGGYVLPGANPAGNQIPLPDDLEQCCIEQVVYWYQRRTQLGLVSITTEGSVPQQFQASDLLPQVRATLKHYERWQN